MHDREVPVWPGLVRSLVQTQCNELSNLPITMGPQGTVNNIFRLGRDYSIRLPKTVEGGEALVREIALLNQLHGKVSLTIPDPVFSGAPGEEYPLPWAVYRWIEGEPYSRLPPSDETEAARTLATLIHELREPGQRIEAPPAGRPPLAELDSSARVAIAQCGNRIDQKRAAASWEAARQAPVFEGPRVLIHADLLPTNILVKDSRVAAVIDFGSSGKGDPAFDLIAAWAVWGPQGRRAFQAQLNPDEETWQRAKAYALYQALLIVPYYWDSFREFSDLALRTISEVIGP
jgi:aminoglycoside phosphotransferase (APT) family kinase protein